MTDSTWNKICLKHEYSAGLVFYEPDWNSFIKEGQDAHHCRVCRIHIRKTAGSMAGIFLEQWFHDITDGPRAHSDYWHIWEQVHRPQLNHPWDFENGFFYTIVRNPFDWLVSCFFYHKNWHQHYANNFAAFAMDWIEKPEAIPSLGRRNDRYYRKAHHKNIYTPIFESDQPGARCLIPVIIRYERLEEGLNKMLEQFNTGLPSTDQGFASSRPIPHRNRSEHKKFNYKHYYEEDPVLGPKIVEGLLKKHAAEFEMFGYDFDGPIDDSVFINPANLILKY